MMSDTQKGYGLVTIALHWIVALAVIFLFASGEIADSLGRTDAGRALRNVHHIVGASAAAFFVLRFVWRLVQPTPDKGNDGYWLNLLAIVTQWALIVATVGAAATGITSIWFGGRPIDVFGFLSIPSPFTANHDLHEALEDIHAVIANSFIPLVGLHVLGALKHYFYNRDGVMARIFVPAGKN